MTSSPTRWSEHLRLVVTTLHDRTRCYVFTDRIAAVMEIPNASAGARLLVTGGGHVDVCGSAAEWELELRIARLEQRVARVETAP